MIKSFFYVATALLFNKTIKNCSLGCNEQFIGNNSYCDFYVGDCLYLNYLYDTNTTYIKKVTDKTNYLFFG